MFIDTCANVKQPIGNHTGYLLYTAHLMSGGTFCFYLIMYNPYVSQFKDGHRAPIITLTLTGPEYIRVDYGKSRVGYR